MDIEHFLGIIFVLSTLGLLGTCALDVVTTYTIQDVYNYCCKHPEVNITNTGENCTNVINNIYNGCS